MALGLGNQLRPCLRVATFVVVFAVFSILYVVENSPPRSFGHDTIVVAEDSHVFHNNSNNPHKHFLVWSSKCKIPDADPYQKSVMKLMKPAEPVVCSTKPLLTSVQQEDEGSRYRLQVEGQARHNYLTQQQSLQCCHSTVVRLTLPSATAYNKSADNMYSLGTCQKFENETMLDPTTEFILVKCYSEHVTASGKKKTKEVYNNMHAMVPIKEQVKWKLAVNKSTNQHKRLSVLLLGLDSISRLNMIRKMPKTRSYLNQMGWVEFKGYNKVGDNTFPNLMAILTGHNTNEIRKLCWKSADTKIDDCPFIWKNFSEQGYITLYAEDEPTISTYNYHKTGFVTAPTDYYLRPYMLAAEQHLRKKVKDSMAICLGPTSTADHVLNYIHNFTRTFRNALYFGLVWLNNFSHNNPNTPAAMDVRMVHFFEDLWQADVMNSTMIVFFSDHGTRFGKVRETSSGWLEERLPFLYVWVPEWFRMDEPIAYDNFVKNSNQLTSPFDLHSTLRRVLDRGGEDSSLQRMANVTSACPSCIDWFSDVVKERACEEAGITPHWCTCYEYRTLATDDKLVQKAAKYVIGEIQSKLLSSKYGGMLSQLCATLQLHDIVSARLKVPHEDEHVKYNDYLITFLTVPGEAIYESTVRVWGTDSMEIQGVVSRLNSYASQSKCIDDGELKTFCFCIK